MNKKIRRISVTAMFAAMIFVTTMIKITLPMGYIHLGDAVLYLSATLLGGPWALLAGAIGEGLADVVGGFPIYAPATIVIKVLIALIFVTLNKNSEKIINKYTLIACVPAGVVTVGGYFLYELIIDKSFALVDIPGNLLQAAGSAVIFILLGVALDGVKIKRKIKNL